MLTQERRVVRDSGMIHWPYDTLKNPREIWGQKYFRVPFPPCQFLLFIFLVYLGKTIPPVSECGPVQLIKYSPSEFCRGHGA